MTITIDETNKVIQVEEEVNLKELFDYLKARNINLEEYTLLPLVEYIESEPMVIERIINVPYTLPIPTPTPYTFPATGEPYRIYCTCGN